MTSTYSRTKTIDDFEPMLVEAKSAILEFRWRFALPRGCELAAVAFGYQRLVDNLDGPWGGGRRDDPRTTLSAGPMGRVEVRFANAALGHWLPANSGVGHVGGAIAYRLLARRPEGQS
jgi:hypothetical protein